MKLSKWLVIGILRMKICWILFALVFGGLILQSENLISASEKVNIINGGNIISDILICPYNPYGDSISLINLNERAVLMGGVKWTPKHDIPNNIGFYAKDKTIVGLPYSSVKELQKFIGLDVSIYTFLTAVNNPYSLLYSENVAKGNPCYLGGTYNGINSKTFYGTVCSSFTAFCYGEDINYTSYNYKDGLVPNYYLKPDQNVELVSTGDLFWCPGHVALIADVKRSNAGHIRNILLYESSGSKVHSTNYSLSAFIKRMSGSGNVKNKAYLYGNKLVEKRGMKLDNNFTKDSVQLVIDGLLGSKQEICTWFGDRPCLGEWDKLMLNFDKQGYDRIIVSLDNEIIDTLDISKADHSIEYKPKRYGIYNAQLASDSLLSTQFTSFEVINTTTKTHQNTDGTIEVIFAQNSNPEVIYWVDKTGDQLSLPLNVKEEAKKSGKMNVKPCKRKDRILRVIYRGEYGRAINKPAYLFH